MEYPPPPPETDPPKPPESDVEIRIRALNKKILADENYTEEMGKNLGLTGGEIL